MTQQPTSLIYVLLQGFNTRIEKVCALAAFSGSENFLRYFYGRALGFHSRNLRSKAEKFLKASVETRGVVLPPMQG